MPLHFGRVRLVPLCTLIIHLYLLFSRYKLMRKMISNLLISKWTPRQLTTQNWRGDIHQDFWNSYHRHFFDEKLLEEKIEKGYLGEARLWYWHWFLKNLSWLAVCFWAVHKWRHTNFTPSLFRLSSKIQFEQRAFKLRTIWTTGISNMEHLNHKY